MPTFTENIHTTPTLQSFINDNPDTILKPTEALYAVDTMRLYQGDGTNKLKDIVPFYYREELNVKISNNVDEVPFFEVDDSILATSSQINKLYEYNLKQTQEMIKDTKEEAKNDNNELEERLQAQITENKNELNYKIDNTANTITTNYKKADSELEKKLQTQITENKEYTDEAIEELKKKLGLIQNPDGSTPKSEILPVGFVYVRFAGMPAPSEMFAGTWSNISSTFAGMFFRSQGGSAAAFGSNQNGGLPNITGRFQRRDDAGVFGGLVNFSGAFYGTDSANWRTRCTGGVYGNVTINFDASRISSLYGAASEVRPINSTIQIWKRTN